jgi:hypothetical protein
VKPRRLALVVLALLFTLLNAIKPLMIDDTAYYYYAVQAARQPLDPYGFEVFWYQHPEPAADVLAPPLLPYWWSLALRLFGERPFLWKLWLLPFSFLLVFALADLYRRFARGLETPLLWMTVLSPTFLPSFNLMLDVPALALSLTAVAVFLRACDRTSWALAVLAGLVAGLAMETKYTGFLAPGVMLLYALLVGKLRLGIAAAAVAGLVFGCWEGAMSLRYGESHLLHHLGESSWPAAVSGGGRNPWPWLRQLAEQGRSLLRKLHLFLPLFPILGGVAPAVAVLGMIALGAQRRAVAAVLGLVLGSYAVVAWVPEPYASDVWTLGTGAKLFTLNQAVFGILGMILGGVLLAVIRRLGRVRRGGPGRAAGWRRYRREWFLVLWLGLEVAAYPALTPFPAVRRVLGILVVATLLTGRLAARTCRAPAERRWVQGVALGGIVLGLGVYGVDLRDGWAEREAAEAAARVVRQHQPGETIWYVGHWGFQFYAEQAGMKPVVPGRSLLRAGDWLVLPDERIIRQEVDWDKDRLCPWGEPLVVQDLLPLRTVSCYYGGAAPVEHHEGPRRTVQVYRVMGDFVPRDPSSR